MPTPVTARTETNPFVVDGFNYRNFEAALGFEMRHRILPVPDRDQEVGK